MNRSDRLWVVAGIAMILALPATSWANEVEILEADFQAGGDGSWSVSVTLRHEDTGWEHYADAWRIVDGEGRVLGKRILHHPHVREQPFSRSLHAAAIPDGTPVVYIDAHDLVHGWTPNRLKVDLGKAVDGRLKVRPDN